MARAEKVVLASIAVLILVPVALIGILLVRYNWDKYQAANAMRAQTDNIAVGDSLDHIEQLVERADAEAVNQPYGSYVVVRSDRFFPPGRDPVHASSRVIRAFWLRTGITCYLELAIEDQIVTQIEDVFCLNDGWLE